MDISFLLDEDTERELAIVLAEDGYDVERVVTADALGPVVDDEAVRAYARRDDRILVTYDDHHIAVSDSEYAGVCYAANQTTETYVLSQVITAILDYHADRRAVSGVVFLSPDTWLSIDLWGEPVRKSNDGSYPR